MIVTDPHTVWLMINGGSMHKSTTRCTSTEELDILVVRPHLLLHAREDLVKDIRKMVSGRQRTHRQSFYVL